MSALYTVEPASIRHVKPLALSLTQTACGTLRAFGLEPRRALFRAFTDSRYSRTALIDGIPVAMWGIIGPALSGNAEVWLALGDKASRYPLSIVRRTKSELADMAERCGILYARIRREDRRAMLFAVTMGFRISEQADDDRVRLMAFGEAA